MKYAYDLCGAEPIIKDMPVYDSALIDYGELVMLDATSAANYTADEGAGVSFITAVGSTPTAGASQAIDALGICLEKADTGTGTDPTTGESKISVATAHNITSTAGPRFAKCIINPFAVYRAEHDSTGGDFTVAASATVGAARTTVTGLTASTANGAYVYHNASAGDAYGELRTVASSTAAGIMVLNNVTASQSTVGDTVQIIPRKGRYSNPLNAAGTMVSNGNTAGISTATNLRVVENYIENEGGFEILGAKHQNVKVEATADKVSFYSDIMMKDHIFGVQE